MKEQKTIAQVKKNLQVQGNTHPLSPNPDPDINQPPPPPIPCTPNLLQQYN